MDDLVCSITALVNRHNFQALAVASGISFLHGFVCWCLDESLGININCHTHIYVD